MTQERWCEQYQRGFNQAEWERHLKLCTSHPMTQDALGNLGISGVFPQWVGGEVSVANANASPAAGDLMTQDTQTPCTCNVSDGGKHQRWCAEYQPVQTPQQPQWKKYGTIEMLQVFDGAIWVRYTGAGHEGYAYSPGDYLGHAYRELNAQQQRIQQLEGQISQGEEYDQYLKDRCDHLEGALREAEAQRDDARRMCVAHDHQASLQLTEGMLEVEHLRLEHQERQAIWADDLTNLNANLREAEAKAALFDLVMPALDEYESYGRSYSWTIEVPTTSTDGKTTYSRQYVLTLNRGVDRHDALQQPKAGD